MTAKDHVHVLRRLAKAALPHRYVCIVCGKRLKVASGVHEEGLNR